jgi:hypothetical protein
VQEPSGSSFPLGRNKSAKISFGKVLKFVRAIFVCATVKLHNNRVKKRFGRYLGLRSGVVLLLQQVPGVVDLEDAVLGLDAEVPQAEDAEGVLAVAADAEELPHAAPGLVDVVVAHAPHLEGALLQA